LETPRTNALGSTSPRGEGLQNGKKRKKKEKKQC